MNFDEDKIEVSKDVSSDDLLALLKSEQIYSNRFFMSTGKDGITRIAFADMVADNSRPVIKCSVLLTFAGLLSLKKLIESSIEAQFRPDGQAQPVNTKPQREELN